jgi:solute carrier family 25 oxoglutarate transporter 11
MSTPKKNDSTLINFGTAGLAGVLAWIVIHPANTLAIRMNLATMKGDGSAKAPPTSFIKFSKQVIGQEGIATLYRGLSAGITRQIFYATSRFGLFEVCRYQQQHQSSSIAI